MLFAITLLLLFQLAGEAISLLHGQRMADEWLPIVVALVISTFLTIAVTAWVLRMLVKRSVKQDSAEPLP